MMTKFAQWFFRLHKCKSLRGKVGDTQFICRDDGIELRTAIIRLR